MIPESVSSSKAYAKAAQDEEKAILFHRTSKTLFPEYLLPPVDARDDSEHASSSLVNISFHFTIPPSNMNVSNDEGPRCNA